MRTPRPHQIRPRGINTLIGNGWLHEASKNPWPKALGDLRSRSAMRKCMYIPIPGALRDLPPPSVNHAAMSYPPPRPSVPEPMIVPRLRDPRRDARMFEAVPLDFYGKRHATRAKRSWWEDPIALGSLLILCPPVGVAAVWSSKHYSNDARWALTVMTALMMCLVTALAVVAIALR